MSKPQYFILTIAIAVALMVVGFSAISQIPAAAQGSTPAPVNPTSLLYASYSTTGTNYSPSVQVGQYESSELQYSLVFSDGAVNTTTLTLQYSNDGINWEDMQLVSAASSTSAFTTPSVVGALWRVKAAVTNDSDVVTATVSAVMKELAPAVTNVTIEEITVLTATVP